jgi:beta-lactamase regulating signal transducer with metallopeptidase domain
MTALLMSVSQHPPLVALGWALLAALWATTVVGVLLAIWRLVNPRASAAHHHAAAVLAFCAALIVAPLAPLALQAWPAPVPAPVPPLDASRVLPPLSLDPATSDGHASAPAGVPTADQIVALAAAAWLVAAAGFLLRLLGGWLRVVAIRRRSAPVADPATRALAGSLAGELGLPRAPALLESREIDAPVVIGWRRPALLLPRDVLTHLPADRLVPVVAHELAHVARHDYAVNLLQSIAEALLCFSPAVLWISRCVRETREYCCDDVAVGRCADAGHYVQALTTLASLGTIDPARPVMGASGPRLIVRARRLLHGGARPAFARLRLAAFAVALVALATVGTRAAAGSADRAARVVAVSTASLAPAPGTIPYGYAAEQEGSGVTLAFTSPPTDPAARATITNRTIEPVVAVRFVAVAEFMAPGTPVRLFTSDWRPVSVAPGTSADVIPDVLSPEDLSRVVEGAGGARVQLFFGLAAVRYANGWEWSIRPNPAALEAREALAIPRPSVPRAMIDTPDVGATQSRLCRDDRDRGYSPGALVAIRNEPGRVARCDSGRWVEDTAGR